MQQATVHIQRYDPDAGACQTQAYAVQLDAGDTVLQALLHIYEEQDSTLAFRCGCRGLKCGQCVVEVNGVPRLACLTRAEDGMTIAPLKNLPRLRDLIVDRSPLDERLATERLYVVSDKPRALEAFRVPEIYKRLIGCLECYGCVSTCPRFDWRNETFGGPYVFVRLAQLHLDPRDTDNRQAQAHSLGIESCRDCAACRCVKGIAIRKDAIETLLDTSKDEANQG